MSNERVIWRCRVCSFVEREQNRSVRRINSPSLHGDLLGSLPKDFTESSSCRQRFDPIHFCPKGLTGIFQVKIRLKTKPESVRHSEELGQPQGRIGGNSPLPLHNLIDPSRRNMNVFRQSILAQFHGFQKLFKKNFSWMDWRIIPHSSSPFLMIVHNFHFIGVCFFPKETDAVLVIDADAPLSFSGPLQRLQTIPRRNAKIFKRTCPVENPQFSFRCTSQILWNCVGIASFKNVFGLPVRKRSDHRKIVTLFVIIDNQASGNSRYKT